MLDVEAINEWRGQDVVDPDDQKIGRLEEIYYDRHSDAPGFACVATGMFGRRLTFVPLEGASMSRNHVRVAYPAALVKDAPNVEPDGQLTVAEEATLFDHYGLAGALGDETVSPRLVRYQTQAAAAQVAEARGVVADQGPEPVALAAVGAERTHEPGRQLGMSPTIGRAPLHEDPVDQVAPDRLDVLEQRVAAIEAWLAAQTTA
jgi:PRC-barrel domain